MKILLSYSKHHYNPLENNTNINQSSAGILAHCLYEALSFFGDVEYIDFKEYYKIQDKTYDLFVGINHNFDYILQNANIKKSIYFAVNQHPESRNNILLNFNKQNKYIKKYKSLFKFFKLYKVFNLNWEDELTHIVKNINNADYIFLVGNDIVKQSYVDHGFNCNKLFTFNYELLKGNAIPKDKFSNNVKIIYVATEISQRKGFDIVYYLLTKLKNKSFEFTIVGKCTNKYYKTKLNKLIKNTNNKIKYYDFLNGEQYYNLIKEHDFYLFPSIEEGQAGTVLDAMYHGLIPLITKESGVDFSPLGFLEPKLNSSYNIKIINKIFELTNQEKLQLSNKTIEYYNTYHVGFKDKLKEKLQTIIKEINEK